MQKIDTDSSHLVLVPGGGRSSSSCQTETFAQLPYFERSKNSSFPSISVDLSVVVGAASGVEEL